METRYDRAIFAQRLREAKEKSQLSWRKIGAELGITESALRKYQQENGPVPSVEKVINLACLLGVSLDWLAGLSDQG